MTIKNIIFGLTTAFQGYRGPNKHLFDSYLMLLWKLLWHTSDFAARRCKVIKYKNRVASVAKEKMSPADADILNIWCRITQRGGSCDPKIPSILTKRQTLTI